ncbi:MAG: asparagine synthase (glutamine-hydrolyzing) [Pseudomonadota bacterium]
MCGIAGFVQRSPAPEVLRRMLGRLRHRGPDGEGMHLLEDRGWHLHLGHRRLAIIDVDGGAQPMLGDDGRSAITYNGEVYNFTELAPALQARGPALRTRSDTEVVLRSLLQNGAAAVPALDGMFALALWDQPRHGLLLVRDRLGIKPLYYAPLPDGGLVFGSELTAVLEHPAVGRTLAPAALISYLFSDSVAPPASMVDGVFKLPPACHLQWRDGQTGTAQRYWQLRLPEDGDAASLSFRLGEVLQQMTEAQLVSDVPVGVLLSGGMDSTAVASCASRASARRLASFCVGFRRADFDESGAAGVVASALGTAHQLEMLDDGDALDAVDRALDCLDEPLADHSIVPTYMLCRLAARQVKVVLSGDGADELWGGYPTYLAHRLAGAYGLVPPPLRRLLGHSLQLLPHSDAYQDLAWKLRRFVDRFDAVPGRRHLRWMSSLDLDQIGAVYPAGQGMVPATVAGLHAEPVPDLDLALRLDLQTYLPGSVLAKVDRAAMAHGLEVRPVFLGNAMIELALATPARLKFEGSRGKAPLRQMLRRSLAVDAWDRPKHGFSVPVAAWTRGPLRPRIDAMLHDSPLWQAGGLDQAQVQRRTTNHLARREDFAKPLWSLLVLDHWMRRAGANFEA